MLFTLHRCGMWQPLDWLADSQSAAQQLPQFPARARRVLAVEEEEAHMALLFSAGGQPQTAERSGGGACGRAGLAPSWR